MSDRRPHLLALSIVLCLAGFARPNGQNVEDAHATRPLRTLWQAIDALTHQLPFSKANVERLLSVRLSETKEGGNDVFQIYKSDPVTLPDGVVIENVDLRIRRVGPDPGFLVLDTGGRCIKIDDVRTHYASLSVTDRPRGRSLDEVTSYTASLPWGRLSFGFKERNRQCLASVAFDPRADETQAGSK